MLSPNGPRHKSTLHTSYNSIPIFTRGPPLRTRPEHTHAWRIRSPQPIPHDRSITAQPKRPRTAVHGAVGQESVAVAVKEKLTCVGTVDSDLTQPIAIPITDDNEIGEQAKGSLTVIKHAAVPFSMRKLSRNVEGWTTQELGDLSSTPDMRFSLLALASLRPQ